MEKTVNVPVHTWVEKWMGICPRVTTPSAPDKKILLYIPNEPGLIKSERQDGLFVVVRNLITDGESSGGQECY